MEIDVNTEILDELKGVISRYTATLDSASSNMSSALSNAQSNFKGKQAGHAESATTSTVAITRACAANARELCGYLQSLAECILEYDQCKYEE